VASDATVSVPLDLIDAGTDTDPLAAPEVEVPVPVPAADDVDDDVGAAAADDVVVELLLLPHPAIAATQTSGRAADSHVLIERIALLLIVSQKNRPEDRQELSRARRLLILAQQSA
jgi:hypothetical protein